LWTLEFMDFQILHKICNLNEYFVDCFTHELQQIKCPRNKNDFTVFPELLESWKHRKLSILCERGMFSFISCVQLLEMRELSAYWNPYIPEHHLVRGRMSTDGWRVRSRLLCWSYHGFVN